MAYNLMVEYFFRVATCPRMWPVYLGQRRLRQESSSLSTLVETAPNHG